jgi:hypothetical protein
MVLGVCRTWSKGSGWANEIGIMTPQAGASGGYTFDEQDVRNGMRELKRRLREKVDSLR